MQKVDYSKVAQRYDNNAIRHNIPLDPIIKGLNRDGARVLDIGCGTGTYLATQQTHFADRVIEWHGIDPSSEMLAVASSKAKGANLKQGQVEHLPYETGYFDYVVTRFTFHHFADKQKALAEVKRVLRPGGVIQIVNLAPELSPQWWLYRYFPAARQIDRERFWEVQTIEKVMHALGFSVERSERQHGLMATSLLLAEARNRETSELVLLSDEHYAAGLKAMEDEIAQSGVEEMVNGLTLVSIVGRRA